MSSEPKEPNQTDSAAPESGDKPLKRAAAKGAKKAGAGAKKAGRKAAQLAKKHGPVVAAKAKKGAKKAGAGAKKASRKAAELAKKHGPVVAAKAKTGAKKAGRKASELAKKHGPVVAEKAKVGAKKAGKGAQRAGAAAHELAKKHGPVVARRSAEAIRRAAQAVQRSGVPDKVVAASKKIGGRIKDRASKSKFLVTAAEKAKAISKRAKAHIDEKRYVERVSSKVRELPKKYPALENTMRELSHAFSMNPDSKDKPASGAKKAKTARKSSSTGQKQDQDRKAA